MLKKIFLGTLLLIFLAGCSNDEHVQVYNEYAVQITPTAQSVGVIGDDEPIMQAVVARMLALSFASSAEIAEADVAGAWYARYVNIARNLGLICEDFNPHAPLTLGEAQLIASRIDPDDAMQIQLDENNRNLAISHALWVKMFMQLIDDADVRSAVVLITPEFNQNLPTGNVVTDSGAFSITGLDFSRFLNLELSLLMHGNEVLAAVEVLNMSPTLRNVFIVEQTYDTVTIFVGGAGRTFYFDGDALPEHLRIADLAISGNAVTTIEVFEDVQSGVVKEIGADFIEIEHLGRINLHEGFSIFSTVGSSVSLGRVSQITIGYDVADFVMREGEIVAAIILRRPVPEHIRVLISATGFASRVHDSVQLRSAGGLRVYTQDGVVNIAPNEVFDLNSTNASLMGTSRITVMPATDARIEIMSITRNWPGGASPQYRGFLEISRRDGGFVVVNQLLLEEYLYAVIPSEMPTSFGLEAAKVQAVTARSYAYNQFFANRFYTYGANIDDSVMTQVYNNIPETALAIQAVSETSGLLLMYGSDVVSANYFSTSSGHTADRGDVWINFETGLFDAVTPPFLRGMPQMAGADFGDLSNEQVAREFFMNTQIDAYDSQSPWFRWNFTVTNDQLSRIINNNLPRLVGARPNNFYPRGISNIGDFLQLEVINRGRGGNVNELKIHGTADSVLVRTEFTIRELLTPSLPEGIALNRHGASSVNNHFILPSTFVTFAQTSGAVEFHGGGFGHGVGMSQHGAYGMVRRGYDFRQILAHFYPGTTVGTLN